VVTVVGGKLTTYRQMAQDAVDRITNRPCRTARLPLVGAPGAGRGVPPRLGRRFGAEAAELAAAHPDLLAPVAPGVPALGVEIVAAVEREGALTVEDVLDRRTRLGLVPEWAEAARPAVEALVGERVA
jgi:glycerol-3-phosphate dehydrogenase